MKIAKMQVLILVVAILALVFGFLWVGNTEINAVFPYIHVHDFWRAVGFEMMLIGVIIYEQAAYERGKNDYKEVVMKAIEQVQKENHNDR